MGTLYHLLDAIIFSLLLVVLLHTSKYIFSEISTYLYHFQYDTVKSFKKKLLYGNDDNKIARELQNT